MVSTSVLDDRATYEVRLQKEANFWGKMAEERWKGGIPLTMDFQLATRYRVKREVLGWGDYIQDPMLESLTPFGIARAAFIEYARKVRGKRALDLCCGAGFLSLELARSGKTVDAIDCSETEINVAKKYQSQLKEQSSGKINWLVADLNNHRLPTRQYDVVTVWDGLHHIVNIEGLCEQIYNSLKPGGKLLFCERIWGGRGQSIRTKLGQGLETILNACLPLASSPAKRFKGLRDMLAVAYNKYLLRREIPASNDFAGEAYDTPFEDSAGIEMLSVIQRYFKIFSLHSFGAFSEEACRSLNLPRLLRIPALLILSWFDYFWARTGLLQGKVLMGYARKRA